MSKTITIDELMDENPEKVKSTKPRKNSKPKEEKEKEPEFLETEEQKKKSAEKELKSKTGGDRLLRCKQCSRNKIKKNTTISCSFKTD